MLVPVKLRQAKDRRPSFSAEALALFVELEAVPLRRRHSQEFRERDRALARMLGLGGEWLCSVASVTDRERPRSPPTRPAEHDAHRVYAVRQALLEAAGLPVQQGRPHARVEAG
jgi:hypothetical protein